MRLLDTCESKAVSRCPLHAPSSNVQPVHGIPDTNAAVVMWSGHSVETGLGEGRPVVVPVRHLTWYGQGERREADKDGIQ